MQASSVHFLFKNISRLFQKAFHYCSYINHSSWKTLRQNTTNQKPPLQNISVNFASTKINIIFILKKLEKFGLIYFICKTSKTLLPHMVPNCNLIIYQHEVVVMRSVFSGMKRGKNYLVDV